MIRLLCALLVSLVCVARAIAATPAPTPSPAEVVIGGELDTTFGVDGRAVGPPGLNLTFDDVALQPDGKIVGVGSVPFGTEPFGRMPVVARYDGDGRLDEGFGDAGTRAILPAIAAYGFAIAVNAHGDIIVAGTTLRADRSGFDLAVFRLTPGGAIDTSFAGGAFTIDLGPEPGADTIATAVITRGDRRLVVVGAADTGNIVTPLGSVVLVGLLGDGTLDPDFGDAGVSRFESGELYRWRVADAVEEPGGAIVVAATVDTDIIGRAITRVLRFDRNGRNPEPFASQSGYASGLVRHTNGTWLVSGGVFEDQVPFDSTPVLRRFEANGTLDATFGEDGVHALTEDGVGGALAIDRQDRILLAGDVLSRHRADGSLDPSFGEGGVVRGAQPEGYAALALQPDGKIVAAGGTCESDSSPTVTCTLGLVRYAADRTQRCGDADGDTHYSVTDAIAALRLASELPSTCVSRVCDVDGDGVVSVTDGVGILRAVAELPTTLSCGGS